MKIWELEWPLKDIHALIPRTYRHVAFQGKRDFENVVKIIDFKNGESTLDFPGEPPI